MCNQLSQLQETCDQLIQHGAFADLGVALAQHAAHTEMCTICRPYALFYRAVWLAIDQHDPATARSLLAVISTMSDAVPQLLTRAFNFQAMTLEQEDRYSEALRLYQQAADFASARGDGIGLVRALFNQAIILNNRLDQPAQAGQLLDQAEVSLTQLGDTKNLVRIVNERGLVLLRQQNWQAAEEAFRYTYTLCTALGNEQLLASCEVNLGSVALGRGDLSTATAWYNQALTRSEADWEARAEARFFQAKIAQIEQRGAAAHADLILLAGEARASQSTHFLVLAQLGLARLAASQGNDSNALASYWQAVTTLEGLRSAQDVATVRSDLQAQWQAVYPEAVACALRLAKPDDALLLAEHGRARLLLETIGAAPDVLEPIVPLEQLVVLDTLRSQLHDLYVTSIAHPRDQSLYQQIAATEAQITRQRATASRYTHHSLPTLTPPSLAEIQAALLPDAIIISYLAIDGKLHALITHQAGVAHQPLSASVRQILARLNEHGQLRELLPDTTNRLSTSPRLLALLAEALLTPLRPWLTQATTIYLVPDPLLHHLPFHLLLHAMDQIAPAVQPQLRYLPSAAMLTRLPRLDATGSFVAIGTNRPNLGLIEAHVRAVSHRGLGLWGAAAQRHAVAHALGTARQIYLAGHNHWQRTAPEDGGILLDNGVFTPTDLQHLSLVGCRVVLGACQSNQVATRGGDWLGLTGALLRAGAAEVIGSLWPVSEVATCLLLEAFWAACSNGASTSAALHQAQVWLRALTITDIATAFASYELTSQEQRYLEGQLEALVEAMPGVLHPLDHPYYWGAFVVVGA